MESTSFACPVCGHTHPELLAISSDAPAPYADLPEDERAARATLTADTCVIDGEQLYIRALLEIPVDNYPGVLGFNVWISQSRDSFDAYVAAPTSTEIGPTFGWLSTSLSCYPRETLMLKTVAYFRGGGLRPMLELEDTNHPLAIDQRTGISLARACELMHHFD